MNNDIDDARATTVPDETASNRIGGWLLFYALGPTCFGGVLLSSVWVLAGDTGIWGFAGPEILRIVFNAIGLYMIFLVRSPVTRYFHIVLNAVTGGEYIFLGAIYSNAFYVGGGIGIILIWSGYWLLSKRVRATYCPRPE